ncbi:phage protein [Streptococcus pneumoniae]|uniref:DUF1642 domain-containing protein n=1 Tax=Streptococcus pneumoniae TaxID=1313 RepID=UPI001BC063F3|nr:DUF1642 domain-containing protein [Streptococcus pneumoniae]CAG5561580.1 phage protein [Streptococcus pneumoniae]
MNKQELIKKLEERRTMTRNFQGYVVWWKDVKEIFEQLGEPQPVKVPQFVADFIAEQKKLGHTLSYSIDASMSDIVAEWYWDNSELFALAWLNGYEVEEEKRYTVVMKATKQPLYYNAMDKKLFFSMGGLATKFTRKQLEEAGVGWVFDCPGIEIEEVE